MENTKDRNVSFIIDNNLVTPALLTSFKASSYSYIKNSVGSLTALQPIPSSYYTLSNPNTILIKAGDHEGTITIKVDSTSFLADPLTIDPVYVLPLYITAADADSIIEPKRSVVVAIRYEHMLFGYYLHGGVTTVKDPSGATIQTIPYYTYVAQPDNKIWTLTTTGPGSVAANGYSDKTSTTKKEMILSLNGPDITVTSAPGSSFTFEPNGSSTYNGAKLLQNRKILLNYKYVNSDGNTCYAQDTLTFRNRIRDGVNEWQDENPSHYLKK